MWVSFFIKEKNFCFKPVEGNISGNEGRAQIVNKGLYVVRDNREVVERGVIKPWGGVRFGVGRKYLRTRIEQTVSKLQHDQPHHVLLGDFNTYLQPLLDTENVKHPKHWPWLHNQVHPPSHSTTPTLIDLYRKDHPEAKQWTRPTNPLLHSQTRIDLILSSPAFHTICKPFNTYIDSNNSTTDHRPVSTAIAIPNNPLNIYHIPQSTIHHRPLNKNEKAHLTSLLQPLDTWVSSYNSIWNNLALDNIVSITDFIFSQLVTAYKRVTLQAHAHKPTGIEKKLNEQALKLNTQKGLNKQSLTTLQSLLNDWNKKNQTQNHKKLHYSLIQNKRITKTINNILHPRTTSPLSLYDTNGNLTSDPNAMCQSMGESLISLGGPPSFDIDTSFIDKVMTNSPKLPDDAPHSHFTRQFFDHLLSNPPPPPYRVKFAPLREPPPPPVHVMHPRHPSWRTDFPLKGRVGRHIQSSQSARSPLNRSFCC